MADNKMNPLVDAFLNDAQKWREELEKLRAIALDCNLTEELKWGWPCYTFEGNNVIILHGFKGYCAAMFVKGTLLKDASGVLIQQTENVQSARQIRFTSVQQIAEMEPVVKAYIHEAIEVEKAGLKEDDSARTEVEVPDELQSRFGEMPALKTAFEALTPGRQRAYLFFFTEPKQSKTRVARIEKYIPQILAGKGLHD